MCVSGVIDEINKDRKMHYKHQFLLLTIEFYYRFVVPSPLSIIVQILALIKKDFRKNPFGINLIQLIVSRLKSDCYTLSQKSTSPSFCQNLHNCNRRKILLLQLYCNCVEIYKRVHREKRKRLHRTSF